MKRIDCLSTQFVFLFLCGIASNAHGGSLPFHVTATGGFTMSTLRNVPDPFDTFDSMKSLTGGVGANWTIAKAIEIQPEILYTQKGISLGKSDLGDHYGDQAHSSAWTIGLGFRY
jgi:hypothetical protein